MADELESQFTIQNEAGLHARPAAMFVKLANSFEAEVWVEKDDEQINGKSIMGLMMLAAGPGSTITVLTEGSDAKEAMAAIETLINSGFQEN